MEYKLSKKIRLGNEILEDGSKTPWTVIRDNGDFRRTIDFSITGKGPKEGVIFQYIQKNTIAYGVNDSGKEILLNTSDSIANFTDNNVKHMCTSYLEYFKVDPDGTTWGDQFGNGAISRYDEEGAYLDRELDISKGTITQIGTSVFLTEKNAQEFTKLNWNTDDSLPANGLPYLPFNNTVWNRILNARQSNILTQKITIVWDYKDKAKGRCIECDPPIRSGGSRRKTRKGLSNTQN